MGLFTSYHDLKTKENKNRIWLEGEPLLRAGMKPGDFFTVTLNIDTYTVILNHIPDSPEARAMHKRKEVRKISGRKMSGWVKPIVDVCNADITKLFSGKTRFVACAFEGRIEFGLHHEEVRMLERENRLKNNLAQGKIEKGDAFLGIGISSEAFHQGFWGCGIKSEQKWAVELEARYLDVASKNNPERFKNAHLFAGYVEEIEIDLIEPVDAFSFSMPCTNHSTAGRAKKGLKSAECGDEVTALFGVIGLIKAANPSILISENVKQAQNSTTYQILKKELVRLGYDIHEFIMDKKEGGCLEVRQRYWFVATSKGLNIESTMIKPQATPRIHNNLGDVLSPVPAEAWKSVDDFKKRELVNKENGRFFSMNLVDENSTDVSTIPRNYTKRQLSNPHPTDNKGNYRLFTKFEHADIKRVPHFLVEHCSETVGHEGLGQGISFFQAVRLAEAISSPLWAWFQRVTNKNSINQLAMMY